MFQKDTNNKNIEVTHPIRKDWLRALLLSIHTGGFLFIAALFIWDVATILNEKPSNYTVPEGTHFSLFGLALQPIILDPIILSIVKHLIYLSAWVLFFLMFQIASTRLRRVKMFNFEIELEKREENFINVLNVTTQKISFLSNWATEPYANEFAKRAKEFSNVSDGIKLVLDSLTNHYYENWNYGIEYKIYKTTEFKVDLKIPGIVRKSYELARERFESIPINKENKEQIYLKNYLLTVISYQNDEYAILLSSFDTEFDEYDAVLLSGLVSLAIQYYDRTQILKILNAISIGPEES